MLEVEACQDIPRTTDWLFEDMFGGGSIENIPPSVDHRETEVQNQNLPHNPITQCACTNYGLAHIVTQQNYQQGDNIEIHGEDTWVKAVQEGASITGGWTLQAALDLYRGLGYISGYAKLLTVDDMKRSIAESKFVYTGTNLCDRDITAITKVFSAGKGYGHCFCILGYDDSKGHFIAKNSFGNKYMDGGYFTINYTDIGYLFTKYSILDVQHLSTVTKFKQMTDQDAIQIATQSGLVNGQNGDQTVTREQLFIVIGRLLNLLEQKGVKVE